MPHKSQAYLRHIYGLALEKKSKQSVI